MSLILNAEVSECSSIDENVLRIYTENFPVSSHASTPVYILKKRTYPYVLVRFFDNAILIGIVFCNLYPSLQTVYVDYIAVDKEHQNKGYGKSILTALKTTLFPLFSLIFLDCNDTLVQYYKKQGFTQYKSFSYSSGFVTNIMYHKKKPTYKYLYLPNILHVLHNTLADMVLFFTHIHHIISPVKKRKNAMTRPLRDLSNTEYKTKTKR